MADTFDYAAARDDAEELLAEFGQGATLRRPTTLGGDAWNPTSDTPSDYTCTLVVLEYSRAERQNSLIEAGDKKVLLSTSGLTVTPSPSDKLIINSETHSIVAVDPLAPGGMTLLYEMQVRR